MYNEQAMYQTHNKFVARYIEFSYKLLAGMYQHYTLLCFSLPLSPPSLPSPSLFSSGSLGLYEILLSIRNPKVPLSN